MRIQKTKAEGGNEREPNGFNHRWTQMNTDKRVEKNGCMERKTNVPRKIFAGTQRIQRLVEQRKMDEDVRIILPLRPRGPGAEESMGVFPPWRHRAGR